jgi:hypothetical protein
MTIAVSITITRLYQLTGMPQETAAVSSKVIYKSSLHVTATIAIKDLNGRSAVCLVLKDQCLPDRADLSYGVWVYEKYLQILGRFLFVQV